MRFSKSLALAAMFLAVPLAACAGVTSPVETPSSTSPTTAPTATAPSESTVGIVAEKAVFRASQAFTLAVISYRATVAIVDYGVELGLVRGALAGTIQGYNREALNAIRKGQSALNRVDEEKARVEAIAAIAKITALPVIKQVQKLMGLRTQQ